MVVEEGERTRLGSESDEEGEEEIEGWRRQKWLSHYAPHHRILLVGEGDFSFSSSLASAFGSASNVTATSLDHYDALIRKYKKAKSNVGKLKKLGASLLHGVDATGMKDHPDLRVRKFDRIIFNFPHAGFHGKENNVQLINMHRELVYGFFWNASQMLRADGEVHVSHKTEAPYCYWKLEQLASWNSLKLTDQTAFESKNYPGYHHKRGDGSRCDELFPLGPCSTFKFRFYPGAWDVLRESMTHNNAIRGECRQIYVSPVQMPVDLPPIYERSVQVHVGFERIYENLIRTQEQEQLLPLLFGPFPSMTHVPLPKNTHIELGMNSRNEYGGIGACHQNIMQEPLSFGPFPSVTHVPLPTNTHIELGMNSRNEYGGIGTCHQNIMQEPLSFGPFPSVTHVPLPTNMHIELGMNSRNEYGGIGACHQNIMQEPLSFGPFPSMTHVLLPRNTHIQLGMNSRNEYGGIGACHQNIMQEPLSFGPFPSMTHVPLPRNTHIELGMNSRNEYGGIGACHQNIMQEPLSFGPFPSITHVPLPRNTHNIELEMNSRNEYGGIGAHHRNIMQEIPHRTCYDDAWFRLGPLPDLAPEQHYADVERRTSVGDLHRFQGPQHRENLRRLIYSFGRP
ncbi:uncharacterized protein LOC115692219 isoform X1 [Syzygium oleosum]|uniref:uncharacterized protein LOC115692219 isoform X1 n=1 Tax=Syzygium oleosum TaxID=219896 RepID=UPI0024BA9CCC|nr:uncharacterized protein LOC115692219 isoform X1 [Syzygium oleosum]